MGSSLGANGLAGGGNAGVRSTLTGRSVRNFVFDFLLLSAVRRGGVEWRGRREELSCLSWSWPNVLSAGGRIFVCRDGDRTPKNKNKK